MDEDDSSPTVVESDHRSPDTGQSKVLPLKPSTFSPLDTGGQPCDEDPKMDTEDAPECNFCDTVGIVKLLSIESNNFKQSTSKKPKKQLDTKKSNPLDNLRKMETEANRNHGPREDSSASPKSIRDEFLQILADPSAPFMIPATYTNNMAEKVYLLKKSWHKLPKENQDDCNKHGINVSGLNFERYLYTLIEATIKRPSNLKNIFVVSGFKFKANMKIRELDFLLIHDRLRLIIHVEAKTSLEDPEDVQDAKDAEDAEPPLKKKKKLAIPPGQKAKEQLDAGLQYFREICADKDWGYCKVLATRRQSLEKVAPCGKCRPFLFSNEETFEQLLNLLEESSGGTKNEGNDFSPTYNSLLNHFCSKMKTSTPTCVAKATLKTADTMTSNFAKFLLWNGERLFFNFKRVIMTWDYGTGKTTLLKLIMEKLATSAGPSGSPETGTSPRKKILIVIPLSDSSLLVQSFREFSRQCSDFEVCNIQDSGSEDEFWQNIFNRLRADPDVHVLMDEVAFRETGAMTTSRMKQFAEMIKKDNYFWVACKKGCTPFSEEDDLKDFKFPKVNIPVRYPSALMIAAEKLRDTVRGSNWPCKKSQVTGVDLANMGIRPTLILKNQDTSILSAVDQLIRILENLKIPFIVVVEVEFEDVLHALKSSGLLNNRICTWDHRKDFKKEENQMQILVVNGDLRNHLQGFECLGMVIISTSINGTHCMDLVSRCNGTLILITNESELGNLKSDHETFDIVRVPSNVMPKTLEGSIERGEAQFVHNRLVAPTPDDKNIVNQKKQSGSILSCTNNQPGVLQVYINAGADLSQSDGHGYSAVAHAIKNVDKWTGEASNKWQCVDKLVNQLGPKVLDQAAPANVIKTVEYILRDDSYADTRSYYHSVIEASSDEVSKVTDIMNLAKQYGHDAILRRCELAATMYEVPLHQPEAAPEDDIFLAAK